MLQRSRKRRLAEAAVEADTTYALSRGVRMRLLVLLVASAMLVVGVYAGYRAIAYLWQWRIAQAWVPIPARILSLELTKHGGHSVAYETHCGYAYRYDGEEFQGSRVGLEAGPDNLGTWHEDVYRTLDSLQKSGQPATCFVDPDCPERAVLFRDLRLTRLAFYLSFAVGFFGFGFPLAAMSLASLDSSGTRRAWIRQRVPALSWLMLLAERPEAGHRLRSGLWYWWFAVVVSLPPMLAAGTILARAVSRHDYLEGVFGLFAMSVMLFVLAWWVRWSRSGR